MHPPTFYDITPTKRRHNSKHISLHKENVCVCWWWSKWWLGVVAWRVCVVWGRGVGWGFKKETETEKCGRKQGRWHAFEIILNTYGSWKNNKGTVLKKSLQFQWWVCCRILYVVPAIRKSHGECSWKFTTVVKFMNSVFGLSMINWW